MGFTQAENDKASRRTELNDEMNELYRELTKINSQWPKLEKEQSNLKVKLQTWEKMKLQYNNTPILSKAVTANKFEGKIAEKMQADLDICVSQMDVTYENVMGLVEKLDVQIMRLKQRASSINGRVSSIQNELNIL